jgi:hypothetical protein
VPLPTSSEILGTRGLARAFPLGLGTVLLVGACATVCSPWSLAVLGSGVAAGAGPTPASVSLRLAVLAVSALVGVVALVLGAVAAGPRRHRDLDGHG